MAEQSPLPRMIGFAWIATSIGLWTFFAYGGDQKQDEVDGRRVTAVQILEQLRSDPERGALESFTDWSSRIALKRLEVADELLAHPDSTTAQKEEATERKLSALDMLTGRDPGRYKQRWSEFADLVIQRHPGSPLACKAAYGVLQRRISDNPSDHKLPSEIEKFSRVYPDSGGQTYQLYYRLSVSLYDIDADRSLAILEQAISRLPAAQAKDLRRNKNALKMLGKKLPMPWPKLSGRPLLLDELRGKVVLVYSWATWCGPCIEKFPILNELHATYSPQGFEIVAVSQDDDPSKVEKFLASHTLPWVHVMRSLEYEEEYGQLGTPGSILLDREGVVIARGLLSRKEIESAVISSLAKPVPRE